MSAPFIWPRHVPTPKARAHNAFRCCGRVAIRRLLGSNDTATAPPSLTFATDASVMPGMFGMSAMPGMPAMTAPMLAMGTPAASPTGGPDAVDINNFAFSSVILTVPVGVTVTSTNHDEDPHTVVANDRSFHSPGMDTNGTYSFTFTNAGSFNYVCSIHPLMHGTVVVEK